MNVFFCLLLLCSIPFANVFGQVTTGSISGTIRTSEGQNLEGATVIAVHVPSGTRYVVVAGKNGVYTFPNVRVGGPFKVSVSFTGYDNKEENERVTFAYVTALFSVGAGVALGWIIDSLSWSGNGK